MLPAARGVWACNTQQALQVSPSLTSSRSLPVLAHAWHAQCFKKRAPRAISEIRKFATKMMGTKDVRVDVKLNKAVWSKVRGDWGGERKSSALAEEAAAAQRARCNGQMEEQRHVRGLQRGRRRGGGIVNGARSSDTSTARHGASMAANSRGSSSTRSQRSLSSCVAVAVRQGLALLGKE